MSPFSRTTKLGIAVAALVVAALIAAMLYNPAPPVVVLPNPNGYDDFAQATQIVVPDQSLKNPTLDQLRASVEENSKALDLVRTGLTKQCHVPIRYDQSYITNLLPQLGEFKQMALAFVAEGKLAEKENRSSDAIQSYLDCVKFGAESMRGGLLIEKLVGVACESIGMRELRRLFAGLSAEDTKNLLAALTEIQSKQESADDWMKPERDWSRYSFKDWRYAIVRLMNRKGMRESERRSFDKHYRSQTEVRLLRSDLALKLFRLEKGVYPDRLDELVPKFLDSVPIDPFSDKPMIYRAQTNSYLLHSIGPDRKDDGGVALTPNSKGIGDILSTAP